MKRLLLSMMLVAPLVASPAIAATESFSGSTGTLTAPFSSSLLLPQFDPALGTLTDVQVS